MQAVRKTALTVCVQIKPQLLHASFASLIQVSVIIFEYGHFSRNDCLGPATEGTFPEDTDCSGGPQTVGTPSERRFASVMRDSPLCIILRCAGAQTSATAGAGRK